MTEETKPLQEMPIEAEKTEIKVKKKKDPREKLFKSDLPLVLTSSPHDYNQTSVPEIMWSVVGAAVPAAAMGVYYFGLHALLIIIACIVSALITEVATNVLMGRGITVKDGSAAITGLLLALTLPPGFSLVNACLGSIFAIAIGKQVFGGLGYNIFNPAFIGRAFLQASFPVAMTTWVNPITIKYADATTAATPLGNFKFEKINTDYIDLITGNIGGSIGETSAVAVALGGVFLLIRKMADWRIPFSFLGSLFIFSGILHLVDPVAYASPIFHVLSGGALFGAFFMLTDMVTSPVTPKGTLIFGAGCGFLLVIIRVFGGLPEGVMYSVLLMNSAVPLINRYTRHKYMGEAK